LSPEAVDLLCRYDWPENERELSNEIRRLALFAADGEEIGVGHLSEAILDQSDT
jgi:transcriptional regulator with PAS, ATPase and Fis domain